MYHGETGIPGSPAPASSAHGDHFVGTRVGYQAAEQWPAAGQREQRSLASALLAPNLWRVTVLGTNVLVTLRYGTQKAQFLRNLRTPVRVVVPGFCDVDAVPLADGDAEASCTITAVSSGLGEEDARLVISGAQAIPPNAVRYRALTASVVSIGGVVACNLTATQSIPLIAGSSLTSGDGYLEFDP